MPVGELPASTRGNPMMLVSSRVLRGGELCYCLLAMKATKALVPMPL